MQINLIKMIKPHEKYVELSNSAKEKYPMNRHLGHRAHLHHTAYTKEEEKKNKFDWFEFVCVSNDVLFNESCVYVNALEWFKWKIN